MIRSDAPQKLGFEGFLPEVREVLNDHKQQQKVRLNFLELRCI